MMRGLIALTCALTTLLALLLGWLSYRAYERADDRFQQSELEAVDRQFRASITGAGRMVMAQADTIVGLPGVTLGLATADRREILLRLTPSFETLKNQFGLDLVQAIRRDNVVFARVQDPLRFGDNLSKGRPMVVRANVTGQAQNGIEVGSGGLRVRAVVPVVHDGQQVGVFEVGQNIERLMDNLRRTSGADVGLMLNANVVRGLNPPPTAPRRERIGDMMSDVGTNWQLVAQVAKDVHFAQVKDPAFSLARTADHTYAVMQSAFTDYSGVPIGNFIAIKEVDGAMRARREVLLEIMSVSLVGAIALISIILVMFRGLLLVPVTVAAKQAEALAQGGTPEPLAARTGSDPISRLYAALNTWRAARISDAPGAPAP